MKKIMKKIVGKIRNEKNILCGYVYHVSPKMRPHPYAFLLATTPVLLCCSTSKHTTEQIDTTQSIQQQTHSTQITHTDIETLVNQLTNIHALQSTLINESIHVAIDTNRVAKIDIIRTISDTYSTDNQSIILSSTNQQTKDATTYVSDFESVKHEELKSESNVKKSHFDLQSTLKWLSVCLFLVLLIYLCRLFSKHYL